jgi:peptide/nickel transport system permease protein
MVMRRRKMQRTTIPLPIDQWVMGLVSVLDGFPGMFLILVLVAMLPVKGWLVITLVIALLRWPVMARYMRAEVFRMKEMNYIRAAQLVNLPDAYILRKHIVPYAFRPVMISFIFGVASAILAESTLSFIGIGLPPEEINWGRLLSQSRNHLDAWWLVVFPGFAIFFTLLSLNAIGDAWRRRNVSV